MGAAENRMARAIIAAQESGERQNAAAAAMTPTAGGAPVQSGEEAAAASAITAPEMPTFGAMVMEGVQPRNLIPTAAEIATQSLTGSPQAAMAAGVAAQPLATAAQRFSEGKPAFGEGYGREAFSDTAFNVAGQGAGVLLGKGVSALGQSASVQGVRGAIARWAMGKVTPDALDAYRFSKEMVGDVENAVNAIRRRNGKPAYSRQAVEAKIERHLAQLKKRGAFTIPELTSGNKIDALEPLASGSVSGKGTFVSKQEGKDALMEAWPKVFAATLGDEAPGPDDVAAAAVMALESGLRAKQAAAGAGMQQVEEVVGDRVVDIGPEMLDPLARQLELYSKRIRPSDGAKKVALDPEGIERPLNAAIGLVERHTGLRWDPETNTFVDRTAKELAEYPPHVIEAMRAQGVLPETKRVPFTFADIKTLRSHINAIQDKLPEGEKNQANATLGTLSSILRDRLNGVLDAEDAASGTSLRAMWDASSDDYAEAMRLRRGFPAQGWVEALRERGSGAKVIGQVWPDDADTLRVTALRDLLGGEKSPQWQTVRRFKVEQMLQDKTGNPGAFVEFLTDPKVHSEEYWNTTLGKENYERVLKFAKTLEFAGRKNPFQGEAGLSRRVEAGYLMRFAGPAGLGAVAAVSPAAAAGAASAATGWLVTTRKVAQWLTDPEASKMFLNLAEGKPLKMKERVWLRNEIVRSAAGATMDEEPDIRPIPRVTTRENYGAATGRTGNKPATYGGARG